MKSESEVKWSLSGPLILLKLIYIIENVRNWCTKNCLMGLIFLTNWGPDQLKSKTQFSHDFWKNFLKVYNSSRSLEQNASLARTVLVNREVRGTTLPSWSSTLMRSNHRGDSSKVIVVAEVRGTTPPSQLWVKSEVSEWMKVTHFWSFDFSGTYMYYRCIYLIF